MKLLSLILASSVAAASASTIIDQWEFTHPDGTGLSGATSNNGVPIGGDSPGLASVQGNQLQFSSTNTNNGDPSNDNLSSFRTTTLSSSPSSGKVEVSWTITTADFTNSLAVSGSARVGFFLRDTTPGVAGNNDLGMRLEFNGSDFNLQYTDATGTNQNAAGFSGATISDLDIRYIIDFGSLGTVGSFQGFYTLGAGSEQLAITGTAHSGFTLEQFRTVQQVTNGGTNWITGDTLNVDNLTVAVPEPSSTALLGLTGLGLLIRRRK